MRGEATGAAAARKFFNDDEAHMQSTSCKIPASSRAQSSTAARPPVSSCRTPAAQSQQPAGGLDVQTYETTKVDFSLEQLRACLAGAAAGQQSVYAYVIATVGLDAGKRFNQVGSAPNWAGGLVTLCTCKHWMRSTRVPEQWQGQWIVGLTGHNRNLGHVQSLVYLMRVGQAFASHAALVQHLRAMGREAVVEAKNSRHHKLGDLMIPRSPTVVGTDGEFSHNGYFEPVLGHAHRQNVHDSGWHDDVDYSRRNRRPALLVGDPEFSFRWSRPLLRRRQGQAMRGHRRWTLDALLQELTEVAP